MVKLSQSQTKNRKGRGRRKSQAGTGASSLQWTPGGGSSQQMSHRGPVVRHFEIPEQDRAGPSPLSLRPWGQQLSLGDGWARGSCLPHPAPTMTSRGWKFPVQAGMWVFQLTQSLPLRQPHHPAVEGSEETEFPSTSMFAAGQPAGAGPGGGAGAARQVDHVNSSFSASLGLSCCIRQTGMRQRYQERGVPGSELRQHRAGRLLEKDGGWERAVRLKSDRLRPSPNRAAKPTAPGWPLPWRLGHGARPGSAVASPGIRG